MYNICLVEDERKVNDLVKKYLENEGYNVISCYTGNEALNVTEKIDLWILDIMLPDEINGYDIIKQIRKNNSMIPVIFASARDQDLDRIIGLELEADDYISKPYSPKELVLRVNRIIKRVYKEDFDILLYDPYKIDTSKRKVKENNKEIILTTLEFDLLLLFINNKGRSFQRADILEFVWGKDYFGSDRVVDELIRRLRKKMRKLNIDTIYGYGYRLN